MQWRRIPLAGLVALGLAVASLGLGPAGNAAAAGTNASSPPSSLPLITPQPPGGGGGGGAGDGGVGALPPSPPPPPPDSGCCAGGGGNNGGGGGGGGNNGGFKDVPGNGLPLPSGPNIDLPLGTDFLPGQAIAVFRGTDPVAIGADFAADHDSAVVDYFQLARLNLHVFLLQVSAARPFGAVLQEMAADPRPLWIQRDQPYSTTQSAQQTSGAAGGNGAPTAARPYAFERINLGTVRDVSRGASVRIAMVDSGVDLAHESLAGARISAVDVIRNTKDVSAEGHGTAIAGIMLGRNAIPGIAPEAELLAIRAFHQSDARSTAAQSSSYYVAKGISHAVDAKVQVINLSLTGPQDRLVTQIVEQALMARIAVIAAAGNAGAGAPPAYPAAQPGVIAVTATDGKDRLYKHANRGSYVTLAAPGVDILCAAPGNGYAHLSGTSMAAAYVSGLAGLMLDRHAALAPTQLRKILELSATDLGRPSRDPEFGAGRIDAAAAFARLAGN